MNDKIEAIVNDFALLKSKCEQWSGYWVAEDLQQFHARLVELKHTAAQARVEYLNQNNDLIKAKAELAKLRDKWDESQAADKPIAEALIELAKAFGGITPGTGYPAIIRMAKVSVEECQAIGDMLEECAEEVTFYRCLEPGSTLSKEVRNLVEQLRAKVSELELDLENISGLATENEQRWLIQRGKFKHKLKRASVYACQWKGAASQLRSAKDHISLLEAQNAKLWASIRELQAVEDSLGRRVTYYRDLFHAQTGYVERLQLALRELDPK